MEEAISYIRVSSEEQADSGLGLEAQRQRIAAYCAMKGLRLAEVFEDPGISGGKPLATRPAGSQLLAAVKKRKVIVIVAKLDRLFRSVADAASVIADFDKKSIQLVAIAEAFDMSSPYGRAMAQMASVFAELERAMIRERTRSAMSVKRSRASASADTHLTAGISAPAGVSLKTLMSRKSSHACANSARGACPTVASPPAWGVRAFCRSGASGGF
ncbi:MAG TPA: recombinase family protein, partial [Gemmataceae bacterium]|nr:recombinase family protein [Gemmataceae bacterium]